MKRFLSGALCVLLCTAALSLGGCSRRVLHGRGEDAELSSACPTGEFSLVIQNIHFRGTDCLQLTVDPALDDDVVVIAPQNILDTLHLSVDENGIRISGDTSLRYADDITVRVGAEPNRLHIEGAAALELALPTVTDFTLHVDGAVSGHAAFGALDSLSATVNGATAMDFTEDCSDAAFHVNGACDIDAEELHCAVCSIVVNGAASARVWATERLHATVNGTGKISYGGSPARVEPAINGLGTISPIDKD